MQNFSPKMGLKMGEKMGCFCTKILGQNCKDFSCTNFCREKIEF